MPSSTKHTTVSCAIAFFCFPFCSPAPDSCKPACYRCSVSLVALFKQCFNNQSSQYPQASLGCPALQPIVPVPFFPFLFLFDSHTHTHTHTYFLPVVLPSCAFCLCATVVIHSLPSLLIHSQFHVHALMLSSPAHTSSSCFLHSLSHTHTHTHTLSLSLFLAFCTWLQVAGVCVRTSVALLARSLCLLCLLSAVKRPLPGLARTAPREP